MYSVFDYGSMIADPRAEYYAEALRRTVRPGSVVVDLGAGTGIWSAFACTLGARRVYAIEPDDVIGVAIDMAAANGFDNRITFLQRDSMKVAIDEPADVVVADVRGVLPCAGTGLAAMIDARRFLAPGGVLVPMRDTLWVSVVEAPGAHDATVVPWESRVFGLDFGAARRAAVNVWRKARFAPADLITPPAIWADLDYRDLSSPSVMGEVRLVADRPGLAHGLAVWFESDLTAGVRMSNRPGGRELIYGQAFFPWPSPVSVEAGDAIAVKMRATFSGAEYLFGWDSVVATPGAPEARARFAQSTFDGTPLSLARVRAQGGDAVVTPGPDSEIDRFVLNASDGVRSQRDVAAALRERFPGRFASDAEALARVVGVGRRAVADGGQVVFPD